MTSGDRKSKEAMLGIVLFILICALSLSRAENRIICPQGVNKFSADSTGRYFYQCAREGGAPVLKRCPVDHRYWPQKEACYHRPGKNSYLENGSVHNDLKQLSLPVFGRTVLLGSVYDATRHTMYATESFWKRHKVMKNKIVSSSFASNIDFFAAHTMFERMSKMDVGANLKLEFMGGLISLEGSSAFGKDSIESLNTVAYAMKVHYTTRSEMLPEAIPKDYDDVCKLKHATHVVTEVTYGMNAYFAFTKTVKRGESREEIASSLSTAVRLIPSIKIDAGGNIIMDESLKRMTSGINLKLRGGDVIKKHTTGGGLSISVHDLEPATIYNMSVQAVATLHQANRSKGIHEDMSRSAKAWYQIVTFPDHPSPPSLVNISYHSAKVIWYPPRKIAKGATVKEYVVQYVLLNNRGDKSIRGSKMEQSAKRNTFIILKDLVQGSTYSISVKVVTSLGSSNYSPVLIVKTRFVETELDALRRLVEKEIEHSVSVSTTNLQNLQKNLTSIASHLEDEIDRKTEELWTHHIKGCTGAVFLGRGYSSREDAVVQSGTTLNHCCIWCKGIRQSKGSAWDSFHYQVSNRYCACYKNSRSPFYLHQDHLYYKFR